MLRPSLLLIPFLLLAHLIQFSVPLAQLRLNYIASLLLFVPPFLLLTKKINWSYYSACALLLEASFISFLATLSELVNAPYALSYNVTVEGVNISFLSSETFFKILGNVAMILIYMSSLLILLRHKAEFTTARKVELERYVKCPKCGELAPLIEAYDKYFCADCKFFIEPKMKGISDLRSPLIAFLISLLHFLLLSI